MLLVDDTMLLQKIHGQMLNDLGATVEIAGDGSVAVAMFTEALDNALLYDVVLMDCQVHTFLQQHHANNGSISSQFV